jgi:HAMP domain-containing protein
MITDGDRERAAQLWHDLDNASGALIPAVAEALAAERERALAPILALADELDAGQTVGLIRQEVADLIRRACGQQP